MGDVKSNVRSNGFINSKLLVPLKNFARVLIAVNC